MCKLHPGRRICLHLTQKDSKTEPTAAALPPLTNEAEIYEALEDIRAAEHDAGLGAYGRIAERVKTRSLRVPFLDLALKAAGEKGDFGIALPELLAAWSDYPPVINWAKIHIGSYIARSLRNLFEWRYEDTKSLEALLDATALPPASQAIIVLEAIAHNAEAISAELIFALVGVVAARSPAATRNNLLDDLLRRVTARTNRPPVLRLDNIDAPDDCDASVARLLFASMADVDRRVRWRATHAAQFLIESEDPAATPLVALLSASGETSFAVADFYIYAAREQLLTVLWRVTVSSPRIVARFAPAILECLRSDPHLIVRELGRSVLQDLEKTGAITLSPDDSAFIKQLNRSQLPPTASSKKALGPASFHQETKERPFHFDTMDTIRYWYQPPARLFGIGMESFLDRIEAWVHGRWGYGEETSHWLKEPRLDRIQDEERHVSNRQGSRPMVERLSHYLEWHGMMCALGEMIETLPLTERGHGGGFAEWIRRSMPTIGPAWLSDLRTPAPFEPRFWGHPPAGDVKEPEGEEREFNIPEVAARDPWSRSVGPEVFDSEVLLGENDLVVAGGFELRWRHRIQVVDIRSALVTPETAMALGQALLTAHDRMDFLVPGADEDHDITEDGFELVGWLRYPERESRSDRDDERRGIVCGLPVEPAGQWADPAFRYDLGEGAWIDDSVEKLNVVPGLISRFGGRE